MRQEKKKLSLNIDTLRQLTESEAQAVNGGRHRRTGPICTAIFSLGGKTRTGPACTAPMSIPGPQPTPPATTAIFC